MTQINYLRAGATLNGYDNAALSYIDKEQTFINKTANDLNLPNINTAIAGAMAETRKTDKTTIRRVVLAAQPALSLNVHWRSCEA